MKSQFSHLFDLYAIIAIRVPRRRTRFFDTLLERSSFEPLNF